MEHQLQIYKVCHVQPQHQGIILSIVQLMERADNTIEYMGTKL